VYVDELDLEHTLLKLFDELGRPVHLADFKTAYGITSKRESKKKTHTESDTIARTLLRLFKAGKIAKSVTLARVRDYPVSPYSRNKRKVTTNVRFYAPVDYAGKTIEFEYNGRTYELKFCTKSLPRKGRRVLTKKEIVKRLLKESKRALTVKEILEKINKKYDLYDVSTKQKFYNATTSLTHSVLKKLMNDGLRVRKYDGKYVWYFTEDQLREYQKFYVQDNKILRTIEDLVKTEKCVSLTRVVSMLGMSPDDIRYRVKKSGKWVPVKVRVETTDYKMEVYTEVGEFKRDALVDWLGIVVPRSENGYGYETMLVDLDSDWEEALKKQIKKSLSRINIKTLIGYFYEKLVAKLFNVLCTARELQSHPELSGYMIPFVFRSDRVVNVWSTMNSGRKAEFDVLLRGTFKAFDSMAKGKSFLDLIIPIESKYTVVTTEHVTHFDDKIRNVFGEARNVIPIMVGLSWKDDAMTLAKRFGFMPLYFSSINNLIRDITGSEYRIGQEWRRVEEKLNAGEISLEELRKLINNFEIKYYFEELIEERLGKELTSGRPGKSEESHPREVAKPKEEDMLPAIRPMLAFFADSIKKILAQHPVLAWEYKLDGIRLIAESREGNVRLYGRSGKDLTDRYPEVATEIAEMVDCRDFILDGELVAVSEDGRPLPPQTLLRKTGSHGFRYYLFDTMRMDGEDIYDYSYEERRQILENHVSENEVIHIVPRIISTEEEVIERFFHEAKELGHEGLVAKSTSSPYASGRKNRYWFKYKGKADTLDLVAVGFYKGKGKRSGSIGSLLLAVKENGSFKTIGKVGTGFKRADIRTLKKLMEECSTELRPANVVSAESPDTWLEPRIVVEVSHEGITKSKKYSSGHSLRFPRFVRVREDRDVGSVSSVEELWLSSPSKKIVG
jgi:ATP-dependent DNA ligase